jgi:RND family efflux transporter MFP subunit
MRSIGQGRSGSAGHDAAENAELREEIEELRRELQKHRDAAHPALAHASHSTLGSTAWRPSGIAITVIFLALTAVFAVAFFAGYLPMQKRNALIRSDATEQSQALPRVEVITVGRSTPGSQLRLPGSIQAVTEAPVLARADGYLQRRMVDIGDRVKAGQPLAEIAAPEVDQQILQAKAALQQAQAGLEQALANYEQGTSNMELARVTAERWSKVAASGGVSKQENDQYQTQFRAQAANVQALEKAVGAQRGNIAAAEANLARLNEVQGYRLVKAPFDGVITLRNVDTGALVNAGSTMLFRIAQTETLRTYVNVPQTNASSIKPGQTAVLTVSNLPGRRFKGTVARAAEALDPSTRTMLVEVQVPNTDGALLPGMYAQVELSSTREGAAAPLLVPGDALVVRAEGTLVAVVRPDHRVHFQRIEVGRDFGDRLEVVSGLQEGDTIIPNPGDVVREGVQVDPVAAASTKSEGK